MYDVPLYLALASPVSDKCLCLTVSCYSLWSALEENIYCYILVSQKNMENSSERKCVPFNRKSEKCPLVVENESRYH